MRPDFSVKNRLPRGGNRCDFCACHFVYKLYACQNFDWDGQRVFGQPRAAGRLGACERCAALMDARAWSRLVGRVMKEVKKRKGVTVYEIRYLRQNLTLLYRAMATHIIPGQALTVHQPHYRSVADSDLALQKDGAA